MDYDATVNYDWLYELLNKKKRKKKQMQEDLDGGL